jgi:beta-galactosidase
VALKLTPVTGPGGLVADGADVALFDVEAVDAKGDRCPTFQQRVDFEMAGPGNWRGGYNSGKIGSTNNLFLDLEAGINRVAVRAGRKPGMILVTARSPGLKDGYGNVESNTFGGAFPAGFNVILDVPAPRRTLSGSAPAVAARTAGPVMPGRFIKTLNYTAPNASIVHVELDARDGRNAYVNIDSPFSGLPAALAGADWVQVDNRDALYSAEDLLQLAVASHTVVWVAHDRRLPRPAWLTKQFMPTEQTITVAGQQLDLFRRSTAENESLTLGANTEDTRTTEAAMYLVFVSGLPTKP